MLHVPSSRTTHLPAGALPVVEEESGCSRPPCLGEPREDTGAGPASHHGAACRRRAHGLAQEGGRRAGKGPADGNSKAFDFPVPQKVIKVPKLPFRRGCMKNLRIVPIEHQTAAKLVEVPTVVSFSSLQRTAEPSIDIPGTGRRQGCGGGLQGLHPEQFYSVGGRTDR